MENLQTDSANIAQTSRMPARGRSSPSAYCGRGRAQASSCPAAFLADFESVGWSASLEFARETWDDLIATGRSSLIGDPEFRHALSATITGRIRVVARYVA